MGVVGHMRNWAKKLGGPKKFCSLLEVFSWKSLGVTDNCGRRLWPNSRGPVLEVFKDRFQIIRKYFKAPSSSLWGIVANIELKSSLHFIYVTSVQLILCLYFNTVTQMSKVGRFCSLTTFCLLYVNSICADRLVHVLFFVMSSQCFLLLC